MTEMAFEDKEISIEGNSNEHVIQMKPRPKLNLALASSLSAKKPYCALDVVQRAEVIFNIADNALAEMQEYRDTEILALWEDFRQYMTRAIAERASGEVSYAQACAAPRKKSAMKMGVSAMSQEMENKLLVTKSPY